METIFSATGPVTVAKVANAVSELAMSQLGLLFMAFSIAPIGLRKVYRLIKTSAR